MQAYTYLPGSGVLFIKGPDREDFIQRQSTNDVSGLAEGRVVATVLTNPAARILDVIRVYETGPETLALIPLPGRTEATAGFLKRRIFFNDKVTVEVPGPAYQVIELGGPQARQALETLGVQAPEPSTIATVAIRGQNTDILPVEGPLGDGYLLVARAETPEQHLTALEAAGAVRISTAEYAVLRVEAGIPGPETELTESYTPLEIGLESLISETKGCYTGQEVIARQITYDKVRKKIVGLKLTRPANSGDPVLAGGKPAGAVTSAVESPDLGPIALGVLQKPYDEAGREVLVGEKGDAIPAVTAPLPFPK